MPRTPDDEPGRRRQMARRSGALFAAASVVTAVGLILPHQPEVDVAGLATVAAVAGVVAAVLFVTGERLPPWTFHFWPALGTGLISFAIVFNGERHGGAAGGDEMYYVWVVLWSAYHLGRVATAVQVALVGLAYTAVLVVVDPGPIGSSRWATTIGLAIGSALVVKMLSERVEKLVADLREAASTDPLTGLLNRRAFAERFGHELAVARRAGRPFALVLLDVDRFKTINDRHGHAAGDATLVALAGALTGAVREVDTVARIGGDEFALLLPDTDDAGVRETAQRVTALVAGRDLPAVSAGCAVYGPDGQTMDDLVRAADVALYAAKRSPATQRALS
jgi:diguanylate cyclase (GGDEF)-like protein